MINRAYFTRHNLFIDEKDGWCKSLGENGGLGLIRNLEGTEILGFYSNAGVLGDFIQMQPPVTFAINLWERNRELKKKGQEPYRYLLHVCVFEKYLERIQYFKHAVLGTDTVAQKQY